MTNITSDLQKFTLVFHYHHYFVGLGTIFNMGTELGATTSVFPFNARMAEYLAATERTEIAAEAAKYKDILLSPDAGCKYDQVRFTRYGNSFS